MNKPIAYILALSVLAFLVGFAGVKKNHGPVKPQQPTIIYAVEFGPQGERRITATANTKNLAEITPELDRRVWREMGSKYQSWRQWQDAKECYKLAKEAIR